jgi:hypothetical protein
MLALDQSNIRTSNFVYVMKLDDRHLGKRQEAIIRDPDNQLFAKWRNGF